MHASRLVVNALLSPLGFVLSIVALGCVLRWRRRPRAAARSFGIAALLAWMFCTRLVGGWMLQPLERQYAPLEKVPTGVRFIAVLGSSYHPAERLPVTAALDDSGTRRVVEALRLHVTAPGSTLIFSGSSSAPATAPGLGSQALARALLPTGDALDSVLLTENAANTRQELARICAVVGSEPVVLVTSAGHMPRAMEWARRSGCKALAAPTGQRSESSGSIYSLLVPTAAGLAMSEDAVHEYVGWIALHAGFG